MISGTIWTNFSVGRITTLKVCSNFARESLVDVIQTVLGLMRRTLWTIFFWDELQLNIFPPTSFEKEWFMFSELFKVFFTSWEEKYGGHFFLRKNTTSLLYSNRVAKFLSEVPQTTFYLIKNTLYEDFLRKVSTLWFCSRLAQKTCLMFPKKFFTWWKERLRRSFTGEEKQF